MRNHAPKATAGYQHGVTKGDGASLQRPLDFTKAPYTPPPEREPVNERERLGRAARAAFMERLQPFFSHAPVRWADQPPIQQEAWCDAAQAVLAAHSASDEEES